MSDSFEQIIVKALRLRLRYFMDNLESVREKPSCKNTHALSTSLRRILTCNDIIRDLFAKELMSKKLAQPVKRLRKILATTRDAQEMPTKFKEISGQENRWRKLGNKLAKYEKQMVKKLSSTAENFREDLLKKSFSRKRLNRICSGKLLLQPEQYLQKLLKHTLDLMPQAIEMRDDRQLHKMRIRYKYFRYTAEALAPLLKLNEKDLTWLREFQTKMGEAHDWMVLQKFVQIVTADKNNYSSCRKTIEKNLQEQNHTARLFLHDNIQKLRKLMAAKSEIAR